ncbi:MAG: hypothetical protein ACLR7U_13450 [Ruthenibacterium lactatiformans]
MTLYVSSDAPDTDFMLRLCDVDEAASVKLADGDVSKRVFRARISGAW